MGIRSTDSSSCYSETINPLSFDWEYHPDERVESECLSQMEKDTGPSRLQAKYDEICEMFKKHVPYSTNWAENEKEAEAVLRAYKAISGSNATSAANEEPSNPSMPATRGDMDSMDRRISRFEATLFNNQFEILTMIHETGNDCLPLDTVCEAFYEAAFGDEKKAMLMLRREGELTEEAAKELLEKGAMLFSESIHPQPELLNEKSKAIVCQVEPSGNENKEPSNPSMPATRSDMDSMDRRISRFEAALIDNEYKILALIHETGNDCLLFDTVCEAFYEAAFGDEKKAVLMLRREGELTEEAAKELLEKGAMLFSESIHPQPELSNEKSEAIVCQVEPSGNEAEKIYPTSVSLEPLWLLEKKLSTSSNIKPKIAWIAREQKDSSLLKIITSCLNKDGSVSHLTSYISLVGQYLPLKDIYPNVHVFTGQIYRRANS